MKSFKHILAVIWAILLLLTACGTVPPNPTNTEQTKPTEMEETIPPFATRPIATEPDPSTADIEFNCQYLPETVDNPDNLPILKWVCLIDYFHGGAYGRIWNEAAAIEVNQMLADRNMPFRVQFVVYTSDYAHFNLDWFVRSEVQADIASADLLFVSSIPTERAKEYFMPLTGYIRGNLEPTLKNAVPHKINWLQTTANNEIYGISQNVRRVNNSGWNVDADVLTEYGLTVQDFQKNYWEMDETLKKLNDVSGKRQLIEIPGNASMYSVIDSVTENKNIYPGIAGYPMDEYFTGIGSIFAVEYINDVPTVVNTLDTETAHKIQDAVIRYREKYAAPDAATAKVYFFPVNGHQAFQKIHTDSSKNYWKIPVLTSSYNASENVRMKDCSGVAATSKYQKEAVSLLSLIAEDEEFRTQLMFGKEGRDYIIDANGNYCVTKQEDGSDYNMSFLSPWSYFSGMIGGSVKFPGTEETFPQYEGMTVLETYLEMIENAEPYYAVPFDYSGLQEELIAVEQVCQLYFYRFASLTEEKYAEMLEKINTAGGEKIMKELQKQLDAWVKANPGKPVTPNRS